MSILTKEPTPAEVQIIGDWFKGAKKLFDLETAELMIDFLWRLNLPISVGGLNAAAASSQLNGKLTFRPAESPDNWRDICKEWVKNRAPQGILNKDGSGILFELAGKIAGVIADSFGNVYSLSNLDAALKQITSQPVLAVEPKKPVRRGNAADALANAGVAACTGRIDHSQKNPDDAERSKILTAVKSDFKAQEDRLMFRKALAEAETAMGLNPRNHAETQRVRRAMKDELRRKYPQYAAEIC